MKKVMSVLSIGVLALVAVSASFFLKTSVLPKSSEKAFEKFALTFANGNVTEFTKDKFPNDMILYFFTPKCQLCFAEVREIISFSKAQNVNLLFVTTDSLHNVKSFAKELAFWGIDQMKVEIAKIEHADVERIFGARHAPQSILFGNGLEVKATRKGIISYEFLAEVFE